MKKEDILAKCFCRKCPSYVECKETIGFCLARTGKSKCISGAKGCLCPGCPVAQENNLRHVYYCMRGSEKEQFGK